MNMALCPGQFAAEGVALVRGLVPASLLGTINAVMRAWATRVMEALGSRPIGIGSRNGYHELVQRSPGRFDVPMREQDLMPIWGAQGSTAPEVPWLGLVRAGAGARCQAVDLRGRVLASRLARAAVAHRLASRGSRGPARACGERAAGVGGYPARGRSYRSGARHAPPDKSPAAAVAGP